MADLEKGITRVGSGYASGAQAASVAMSETAPMRDPLATPAG